MEKLIEGRDYTIIDGVLIINEGVREIPDESFKSCVNISSIIFQQSLISIGSNAFRNCPLVDETIVIPNSVKYIHKNAFLDCHIKGLVIGTNVEYIGERAFCLNEIEKIINNSKCLKYLGYQSFFLSTRLFEFNINNDYVYAMLNVFSNESLQKKLLSGNKMIEDSNNAIGKLASKNIPSSYEFKNGILKISDGIEVIGDFSNYRALSNCTRIEMPDSVLIILPYAFSGMPYLETVKFSNNLLHISLGAFNESSYLGDNQIVLPDSLCHVHDGTFAKFKDPKKISIPYHTYVGEEIQPNIFVRRPIENYINEQKYLLNIKTLMAEESKKLKRLGLLPETIRENTRHNVCVSSDQEEILKEFLSRYIKSDDYKEKNNLEDVRKILDINGIDLCDEDDLINYLFIKKQKKTIYLLISYGYKYFNNSMIARAIINDMPDMIDVLLLIGVDINEIGTIDMTPLSIACQKGNIALVKYLIEKGAALNMSDSRNKKPIDYAADNNYFEIVELLESYNRSDSSIQEDLDTIKMQLLQK